MFTSSMTYEQAKKIVEWTAQVRVGEVTEYTPHQVMSALAIMALAREAGLTDMDLKVMERVRGLNNYAQNNPTDS